MPNNRYEVEALIPLASEFSIQTAIDYFGSLTVGKTPLQAVVAQTEPASPIEGFRVWYGGWAIVAWLDESPDVASACGYLASRKDIPASADEIAGCTRMLCIYTDADPDLNHSDDLLHFTDSLRERFGLFIWDDVNGEWWV